MSSASARLPSMRSATENASRWYRCTSGRNASTSPSRQRAISDSSSSSRLAAARIAAISGDASSDAEIAPLSSADRAMTPELEAPDWSTGRTTTDYRETGKSGSYTGGHEGDRGRRVPRVAGAAAGGAGPARAPAAAQARPGRLVLGQGRGGAGAARAPPRDARRAGRHRRAARTRRGGGDRPAASTRACAHARNGRCRVTRAPSGRRPGFAWACVRSQAGAAIARRRCAYAAVVADGAADSAVYANFAEVLMAAGRLRDAEARYRDAISAASDLRRRRSPRARARAGAGLLRAGGRARSRRAADRRARGDAARAGARSDRGGAASVASTPGGDLFFVPEGDVFYYLGLAAEAEGRDGDAEAAFREFLARAPREPLGARRGGAPRQEARRRGAGARRRGAGRRRAWSRTAPCWRRAGIAAPLIDAAWRDQLADSRRMPGRRARDAARDAAHGDRDGHRRARQDDPRHRQGAARRSTSGLRAAWSRRPSSGCGSRCPRPGGRRWRAREIIIGIHAGAPIAP